MNWESIRDEVVGGLILAVIFGIFKLLQQIKLPPGFFRRVLRSIEAYQSVLFIVIVLAVSWIGNMGFFIMAGLLLGLAAVADKLRRRMVSRTIANVEVRADREDGVATGIYVFKGDELQVATKGQVSIDEGKSWLDADGNVTNPKVMGSPTLTFTVTIPGKGTLMPGTHPAGQLVGWIGRYKSGQAFEVGKLCKMNASQTGELFLAVNDAKGTYDDNTNEDGKPTSFFAKVRVVRRN